MMQKPKQLSSGRKGKDGVQRAAPAVEFDITSNVKYESMRNQARHGHLYRHHQDLTRECEKQIRAYELGEKLFVVEFKRYTKKFETRLSQLSNKSETKTTMKYSYNQCNLKQAPRQPIKKNQVNNHSNTVTRKPARTTLLFSVIHRDGEDIYIENQNDRFKNLGPPKALGKSHDDSQIGLRRAEVPRPPPQLVRELTM
ncbi:uncharacterized protein LOC110441340 [Mizuhopecten yessoensis]|uniref:Uncharacterized protein n=1 Tax=Mizuhopecten yessoensis TaxID=6573 RepID=A0A210PJK4_MIZYE|nr:uncharacterized protein LOC110441340 [Mizuhopecten yessoensis]OWF36670.1 hypothetical protein KP79_PYT09336 [Mizuhopecten yessoensis]